MVTIGLLDIPPEIQLRIVEFVERRRALKALSLTARCLRSIAQSMLFEKLQINVKEGLKGSIGDLLANPQICVAIRSFYLRGRSRWGTDPHRNNEETLLSLSKLLPKMFGLRVVWIYCVDLSTVFMDAFLETAAKISLRVWLDWNTYPLGIHQTPSLLLPLRHLRLRIPADTSVDFYRLVLRASATTLTRLVMSIFINELKKLVDIHLPFLHELILQLSTETEGSRTSAIEFITAQREIRKLRLTGQLPAFPPGALPNLRELSASAEVVNQLVPGRPVETVEVRTSGRNNGDWFGEEVAQSTAGVRKLRVCTDTAIVATRMVERVVAILPSLESLWLHVSSDALFKVVEALISLKCLIRLRITLPCSEGWKNHSVNTIATKLREANSCFLLLEVGEDVANAKYAVSVWSETLGVFYDMVSVSSFWDLSVESSINSVYQFRV